MTNIKSIFPIGEKGSRSYTSHFMKYDDAKFAIDEFRAIDLHPAKSFAESVEYGPWFYSISWHNKAIKRLMNQDGAMGTKSYLAYHQGEVTIVLVATDKHGKDIPTFAVNAGVKCPPHCG